MIKILIVEDEKPILDTINTIVKDYCKDVEVIGTATNIAYAEKLINKSNPDLVLLDINLPDGTSFDLLQQLSHIDFKIIFITAFEEFAMKAIKLSALDYLIKPVDPMELIEAINKAKETIQKTNNDLKLNALLSNVNNLSEKPKKIILKTAESIYLIDVQDIVHCESDGSYTRFYINDGKKIFISKVLKDFEDLLEDCGFMRIHKSHIINLNYIDRFDKHEGGYVILKDQSPIPVSFRKKDKLMQMFDNLTKL